MKTINIQNPFSLDVKRLHLPVEIKSTCPFCKTINKEDMQEEYFSYPAIGQAEEMHTFCDKCDEEYSFNVVINISLDISE